MEFCYLFPINQSIADHYFVAIYIRLSKEDLKENGKVVESESIQNQKSLLMKYVKELGYTLVDIYIDDGYTGTNFDRPAFQQMLRDIELGKVNMVITKDLSRLSRDYIGTGEYVEKWFPAHNVRFIALTDSIDTAIDSSNNDIAPFKAILNDMYAKDLSKKIRTALHTMQLEGKWVGGCPPFGYRVDPENKNHLVIDEVEGPIVQRIFALFSRGYKMNQIKNIFNDEQVPTFSTTRNRCFDRAGKRGNICGYWSIPSIKKILKNRLYVGDMVQNRRSRISYKYRKVVCNPKERWIIKEGTHEPIVTKKLFDRVQKLLPNQGQRKDKETSFLLDGILKCADCGHTIGIRSRRLNGKSTTVCNYYRRFKAQHSLCTSHGFDYDTLENGVLKTIQSMLDSLSYETVCRVVHFRCSKNLTKYKTEDNITKIEHEISSLNSSVDCMYMDKLSNKISEDMYERVYSKLLKEIELKKRLLKDEEERLKRMESYCEESKDVRKLIHDFMNLAYPTRDLILKLVNKIMIHKNGDIDIYFNFRG